MKELIQNTINEINKNYNERFKKIENETELKNLMGCYRKTYKGNAKKKFKKFLELRQQKELNQKLEQIKAVKQADNFKDELIITIEWKKSHMWGSNPRAYTNFGFISESIGGCGYCKTSTATAQALNSYLPLLKLLYKKENERLKKNALAISKLKNKTKKNIEKVTKTRRDFIGYGSGYYSLPTFEGGVGVSSHQNILESLGLKMVNITSTENTDVYIIKKGGLK